MTTDIRIFVDADACPVKEEVYKVARRYGVAVHVVANTLIRVPQEPLIHAVAVPEGPDIADDWIAERAGPRDIVVTSDIPLASRCLKNAAQALSPKGKEFTTGSIGHALAGRAVAEHLRSVGEQTRGAPPFTQRDRSEFLQALDRAVVKARRVPPPPSTGAP